MKAEPEECPEATSSEVPLQASTSKAGTVKAEETTVKTEAEEWPEATPSEVPQASTSKAVTVKVEIPAGASRPKTEIVEPTGIVGVSDKLSTLF